MHYLGEAQLPWFLERWGHHPRFPGKMSENNESILLLLREIKAKLSNQEALMINLNKPVADLVRKRHEAVKSCIRTPLRDARGIPYRSKPPVPLRGPACERRPSNGNHPLRRTWFREQPSPLNNEFPRPRS